MNTAIAIAVRLLFVVAAGISFAPATAQQTTAQQIGVISTPGGQKIPVFTEGQLPVSFLHSMQHTRNVRPGSTPASRAAEAAVEAAKSRKWQDDIAQGEALMQAGNYSGAVDAFQQMIASDPNDGLAYRRMAEAYAAAGKLPQASQAFHKVLVEGFGPGIGNGVGDTSDEWAEYALVLVKTGQPAEAVQCYNHAASLLDFEDSENHGGKPHLRVLFPEIVLGEALPEQVPYTPEHLQALADAVLAHEEMGSGKSKEALAHNREAVKLFPDSAVTYYYLGETLRGFNDPGIKAAFEKAVQLSSDPATLAAAKERVTQSR